MASICGVKLTGIQSHMGMEGYTLFANVSVDGKRVGTVCDDAWGGSMNIDIPEATQREIQKRYKAYIVNTKKVDEMATFHMTAEEFDRNRKNGTLPVQEDADLEFFFSELADLANTEKEYKKAVKKGYKAVVTVKYHHVRGGIPQDTIYYTNGSVEAYKKVEQIARAKCVAVDVVEYGCPESFVY